MSTMNLTITENERRIIDRSLEERVARLEATRGTTQWHSDDEETLLELRALRTRLDQLGV